MSVMMNPILPVPGPEKLLKSIERHSGTDNSFADQLDRRLDNKKANHDKLGVADRDRAQARTEEDRPTSKVADRDSIEQDDSVASLLAQFMQELQDVAEEQVSIPGEWRVKAPDLEPIRQLAVDAGMDEMELNRFLQQFGESGREEIGLTEFFAALEQFFAEFEENPAITVPETELPLLETILSRMGLSQDMLEQLSAQAVTRDGVLDLTEFFQELQDMGEDISLNLPEPAAVELSDWEVEQLQNLLDQAGVTLEKQNELLPERFLDQVLGRTDGEKKNVTLTLERLQTIIKEGINEVRVNEPKINLPSFLEDLQKIVSQSGFESESVGWTPVVQETIDTVFQKLQEIVDLANVKVEENKALEEMTLDSDFGKWLKARAEKFADPDGSHADFSQDADFAGEASFLAQENEETGTGRIVFSQTNGITGAQVDGSLDGTAAEAAQLVRNQPMPSRLQQQLMQQLSAGVMRGLRNQEHHLVLRLYPQEMGEVKVNLTVHDDQISVSFNMENSRVKEMLESNMEDFKDSMSRQGFTLEECSVFVGHQGNENNGELWQRFAMAHESLKGARETLADLPDETLYHQDGSAGRSSGSGISVVV